MSSISDYIPFNLNNDQQETVVQLHEFLDDTDKNVFILKGHAGTGKTMILGALIKYLTKKEIPVVLLASTGRAAKIVSDKALFKADTVHRHIYKLDIEKQDDENKVRKLIFRLKLNFSVEQTVYLVDETSMISDREVKGIFADFGTGKLLSDFFTYTGNRKVVFSGDPCQLPPVNSVFSPCLNLSYIETRFLKKVVLSALNEVMRFNENSGISYNTTSIRSNILASNYTFLDIYAKRFDDMHIYNDIENMVEMYVAKIRKSGIDNSIFLTYSNAMTSKINILTRNMLFPNKVHIQKNELLMVVKNNYKFDVANGEHIVVTEVTKEVVKRAGLSFLRIEAIINDTGGSRLINGYIIEELLYANEASLSQEQEYELYIDFLIRMKAQGIKPTSDLFMPMLIADPYLNALRVKYGYAITCHKAQGGEWNDVFMVFENSLFNPMQKENTYRWAYTAISRGIKNIHFFNNMCLK
jgi:ATP-dependent exoDNAse (exonuclease V) alpha subunit